MYSIAIIGDEATIKGFRAGGMDGYPAYNSEEAIKVLQELVKGKKYAVIFLTEKLSADHIDDINSLNSGVLPCITIIPDQTGSMGTGLNAIRKSVEKALGLDIIGKELEEWAEK